MNLNVQRRLDAAGPVLDYLSISDTGWTDNTVELIEAWGHAHGIPTQVH